MKTVKEYLPFLEKALAYTTRSTYFVSQPHLRDLFKDHSNLIFVANHSTPLSWLPTICLLGTETARNGGENRTPIGVMDKFFFEWPVFKPLSEFLTQSAVLWSFDEILDRLNNSENLDLMLFPEGSNCFFGEPSEIQNFRSPRFIELSIMTQTPVVIVVHEGSENWATALDVGEKLVPLTQYFPNYVQKKIDETGILTMPLIPFTIEAFKMTCAIYRPTMTKDDLSDDLPTRKQQVREEAEKVREFMQKMQVKLKQIQPV